jgi:hypothetical protein
MKYFTGKQAIAIKITFDIQIVKLLNSRVLHPVARVSAKLIKVLLHRTQPQFIAITKFYSTVRNLNLLQFKAIN